MIALSLACAAVMGFAIQRGATCAVAAVAEIFDQRRITRIIALGEAALWVAGAFLIARATGVVMALPGGFSVTGWTVAGGAVLGFGAWVNRACVFGAIARLGSGDWAYVATPPGFFLGVQIMNASGLGAGPQSLDVIAPGASLPGWLVPLVVLFLLWRVVALVCRWQSRRGSMGYDSLWSPHVATIVIGVTFFLLLIVAGPWTYTDFLIQLATDMAGNRLTQFLLFAALLGGAIAGGWSGGLLKPTLPHAGALARCLTGGLLMGMGSIAIPGGNDGLILTGLPFLWPYAWVAIGTMAAVIALAFAIERSAGQT